MKPNKTGYLQSPFRLFYLTNTEARDFQSHYHDFHKLLIFESGSLSYYIEGETYQLQPWDIVLVPAGQVHRPVIHDASPYKRLIVYISPSFLEQYKTQGVDLYHCFAKCAQENSHVLRMGKFKESRLYPLFLEMQRSAAEVKELREYAEKNTEVQKSTAIDNQVQKCAAIDKHVQECAAIDKHVQECAAIDKHVQECAAIDKHVQKCAAIDKHVQRNAEATDCAISVSSSACPSAFLQLYQQSVLLQFLLLITRLSNGGDISYPSASGSNHQILLALTYINDHLFEDLSVDQVAANCFLNRSYLMHLFRKETGYTILSYITEKRLFAARTLIQSGVPVTEACLRSGFQSYGAFYRAYRKKFNEPPKTSR